jgi:hypothetical protein
METTIGTQPAEISTVAVRLPPFWAERPDVWFAQVEAQFVLDGIGDERTKFHHIISQLDHRYAAEVEDIIISRPQQDPNTKLRTELLNRLFFSREQRVSQLLTSEAMGDRKPSQFLRHLRSLAPDYLLRTIWTSRLPWNVQTTLSAQHDTELDAADRITEAVYRPAIASSGKPTDNAELVKRIEVLPHRVEALSTERNRPSSRDRPCSPRVSHSPRNSHSSSRNHRHYNKLPTRHDAATTTCWYHRRFGARAQNCTQPCAFHQQRNPAQPASAAAQVCVTTTGRIFVTDKSSKQRFLTGTVSALFSPGTLPPFSGQAQHGPAV